MRRLTFSEAIKDALFCAMDNDPDVICYGLGVTDPKAVFGTTLGLVERFGKKRVFDMPTSENAMTGVAIGASLFGLKPVMVHQRMDFFLLAMDQIVNSGAKWNYMFGGVQGAGITIRLVVGQGWGQGPTHSQDLHAWFSHIPGLKVVLPTSPYDAKGLLLASIFDPNPVIYIEHRWLHGTWGEIPEEPYRIPIGRAKRLATGDDITIVSTSYLTIEAIHAVKHVSSFGVGVDLIDLRSIKPVDWDMILDSVSKTGKLLVLDTASVTGSIAGEIIAKVCSDAFPLVKQAPVRLAFPDTPSPSSHALTRYYYPRAEDIIRKLGLMLNLDLKPEQVQENRQYPHDIPGDWFTGPF